ncbi:efflux RND transporter periplasmic adaptor subunit [Marinifilum sp. D714]|uniref:efflux RND transporter periplasmic adaptor subunit n=1 Tax=Marinifilum sp. D714 TaxID=2937523 RepID=UPI0027C8B044|nr:efflux RND transporter periplasmic adaptor subunit [Marinifilum sp. D714]MDQ2177152.1 efflux RND transporter periplasmic adaptor subunit [Marinifilum sp. D714]
MKRYIWISLALSFLIACKPNNNSHGHDHGGHAHGPDTHAAHDEEDHSTMSLTLYNENTELFVEFPKLMLDHVSKFTTHLTNLKTYKPYTEGSVKVILMVAGKGYSNTVNSPARDGIFTPALMPKKAGSATLVFEVNSKYGKEKFVAKNIPVYKDHEDADNADDHETSSDNEIGFLKEQAWKIDFATSEVKNSNFQNIIKTTGTLQPAVNMEKQVVAKTSGVVHFSSTDIVAGKTVDKNTSLFIITGKGLAGNNLSTLYIEAKLELEKAKAEFDRASSLREDKIVTEKTFLEAKAAYENAQVKFNSINKNYNASGLSILSPVNGFVCDVFVNEGQYVEKGTVLAKVDQGSKLMLKADVYQKHLKELPNIKSANFKLPYRNKVFSTEELNGRMIAYGKDIHEDDYTTPLYFELDLTPELYSGSFVEVYLKSEHTKNVLHIEKSAILEDQGLKYVFVQTGGESFEKRFITIGADNGREVEIIKGLRAGERVVSEGAYFVKLASLAGSLPAHSHEH